MRLNFRILLVICTRIERVLFFSDCCEEVLENVNASWSVVDLRVELDSEHVPLLMPYGLDRAVGRARQCFEAGGDCNNLIVVGFPRSEGRLQSLQNSILVVY